mmetsp:Transcript_103784/g.302933  ORF Transcript_103784/g.302933 Transcript_103784/m.302933 type:complete len:114 (-) Transcript_103784:568-909(-)
MRRLLTVSAQPSKSLLNESGRDAAPFQRPQDVCHGTSYLCKLKGHAQLTFRRKTTVSVFRNWRWLLCRGIHFWLLPCTHIRKQLVFFILLEFAPWALPPNSARFRARLQDNYV